MSTSPERDALLHLRDRFQDRYESLKREHGMRDATRMAKRAWLDVQRELRRLDERHPTATPAQPAADTAGDTVATGDVSDGYHTFDELYAHRHALFAALCRTLSHRAWRAKAHHDGEAFEGYFIAGIDLALGGADKTVTYHLPLSDWDLLDAVDTTLDRAPEWDGHTPSDVVDRLREWASGAQAPPPSGPAELRQAILKKRRRIELLNAQINELAREHVDGFHWLDSAVSTFWTCDESPLGMCVFRLDEHGRKTTCRYCDGPTERK